MHRVWIGLALLAALVVGGGAAVKAVLAATRLSSAIDVPPVRARPPRAAPAAAVSATTPGQRVPAEWEIAAERRNVSIVVYTTTWCPVCKRAKQWLHQNDVDFIERDIEHDAQAMRDCRQINPRASIPTFDIEGATMAGFDPAWVQTSIRAAAIRRLLDRGGG
jgi:glutaredoxin